MCMEAELQGEAQQGTCVETLLAEGDLGVEPLLAERALCVESLLAEGCLELQVESVRQGG